MLAVPASPVSPALAAEIALRHYGVVAAAERLASEFDDTFRLVGGDGSRRLLKVGAEPLAVRAGGGASAGRTGSGFQTALLLHLAAVAPALPVQRVVPALDGRPEVRFSGRPGADDVVAGRAAARGGAIECRGSAGTLAAPLPGSTSPCAGSRTPARAGPTAGTCRTSGRCGRCWPSCRQTGRGGLAECLDRFDAVVAPLLAGVATQVIHTDFHGENLLTDGARVTGILDFGDALTGPVAMDVGVAACYQLGGAGGPGADLLAPALDVVGGYHAVDPLSRGDLNLVAEFMVARVAARIILSQAHAARDPGNARYLLRRTPAAIAHFAALRAIGLDEIGRRLGAACELEVAS